MSYEPTNWKTGDVVTSAKLNKLENGVANGSGILITHIVNATFDRTWKELKNTIDNGGVLIYVALDGSTIDTGFITGIGITDNVYWATITSNLFSTISEDGYPSFSKSFNDDPHVPHT